MFVKSAQLEWKTSLCAGILLSHCSGNFTWSLLCTPLSQRAHKSVCSRMNLISAICGLTSNLEICWSEKKKTIFLHRNSFWLISIQNEANLNHDVMLVDCLAVILMSDSSSNAWGEAVMLADVALCVGEFKRPGIKQSISDRGLIQALCSEFLINTLASHTADSKTL